MKDVQLTLTLEEVNKVLEALGQLPFAKVHQLVGKIYEEAKSQLEEKETREDNNIKSIVNA